MRIILSIWTGQGGSSMRGGGMRQCIRLHWACLRMRVKSIGMCHPSDLGATMLTSSVQVPRYRLPAHPLLQLPEFE